MASPLDTLSVAFTGSMLPPNFIMGVEMVQIGGTLLVARVGFLTMGNEQLLKALSFVLVGLAQAFGGAWAACLSSCSCTTSFLQFWSTSG